MAQEPKLEAQEEPGRIEGLILGFLRWWHGDSDRPPQEAAPAVAVDEGPPPLDPLTTPGWPAERLAVTQAFFGRGYTTVGGADAALEMIQTIGITKQLSVVQLGSGLGGMLRQIATDIGAWAVGYEESQELAAEANRQAEADKVGTKAKTICRALKDLDRKPRIDRAFSKEALFLVEDKVALFKALDEALKEHGVFAFTDYVLPKPGHDSPLLKAWRSVEKEKPYLYAAEDWWNLMAGKGYAVSVYKDITPEYMRRMAKDFEDYARRLKEAGLDKRLKKWILWETERWLVRFACFERGELKVYRFLAEKPAQIR